MTDWDFDNIKCPKYRDLLAVSGCDDDSDAEAYFDAVEDVKTPSSGPLTRSMTAARERTKVASLETTRVVVATSTVARASARSTLLGGRRKENRLPPQGQAPAPKLRKVELAGKRQPLKVQNASGTQRGRTSLRQLAIHQGAQCQSLAEFVGKFHSRTPTRFRRVPVERGVLCRDAKPKMPTIPVTPQLATQFRARSTHRQGEEQKEEQVKDIQGTAANRTRLVAAQKKSQVALQPKSKTVPCTGEAKRNTMVFNKSTLMPPPADSLKSQSLLVPKAKPKGASKTTVAKSPAFALKLRSETWKQKRQEERAASRTTVGQQTFKKGAGAPQAARPRLSRKSGAAERRLTKAQKPAKESTRQPRTELKPFSSSFHARQEVVMQRRQQRQAEAQSMLEKDQQGKHKGAGASKAARHSVSRTNATSARGSTKRQQPAKQPCKPPARQPRKTEVKAFSSSFQARQERIVQRRQLRQAEAQSMLEKAEVSKPTFRAQPAPKPDHAFRQPRLPAAATKPKPFRLASVERHERRLEELKKKQEGIEEERVKATRFVARPWRGSHKGRSASTPAPKTAMNKGHSAGHISRPPRR